MAQLNSVFIRVLCLSLCIVSAGSILLSQDRRASRSGGKKVPSATIKLFLIHADARRLRTAEISNWNGKALAAPRTELDQLLDREELSKSGVYFLLGTNIHTGTPHAYIGEAEELRSRLKGHKGKEFWTEVPLPRECVSLRFVRIVCSEEENATPDFRAPRGQGADQVPSWARREPCRSSWKSERFAKAGIGMNQEQLDGRGWTFFPPEREALLSCDSNKPAGNDAQGEAQDAYKHCVELRHQSTSVKPPQQPGTDSATTCRASEHKLHSPACQCSTLKLKQDDRVIRAVREGVK